MGWTGYMSSLIGDKHRHFSRNFIVDKHNHFSRNCILDKHYHFSRNFIGRTQTLISEFHCGQTEPQLYCGRMYRVNRYNRLLTRNLVSCLSEIHLPWRRYGLWVLRVNAYSCKSHKLLFICGIVVQHCTVGDARQTRLVWNTFLLKQLKPLEITSCLLSQNLNQEPMN